VARSPELDFQQFVSEQKARQPGAAGGDSHAYAYSSDRATRATFERIKPVELAVAAGVRVFNHLGKARLLGQAVKVGPKQFPRVHEVATSCASTLGIAVPTLYVISNPHLNAATYGTNDDAFVMLHSALVDHFSDEELAVVIGHECGHIHNSHVVYLTVLYYLSHMAGLLVRSMSLPALLALRAWARRAEITCDRAAALCVGDLEVAVRTLTKLALGSQKLYEQLDVEVFLEQYDEAQASVGRLGEVFATHPWLPKRVLALRHFGDSELFRRRTGRGETGLRMEEVDERVHQIIRVVS
jgi:Zn-dependent protease with chaperone function